MKDLCLENLSNLIKLVKLENEKQIEKWGIQDHDPPTWMLILNEEVGELNKAVLKQWVNAGDYRKFRDQVIKEAIQVATLALKIAEMAKK